MNCGLLWGNRQDCIKVSCFSPKTGIRKKHQLKLGLCENKATLKVFQINCGLVLFNARWNKSTMFIKGSNIKIHRLEEVLFERFELFRVMCCFASRVRSPAFAHVFSLELYQIITIFAMKWWNTCQFFTILPPVWDHTRPPRHSNYPWKWGIIVSMDWFKGKS